MAQSPTSLSQGGTWCLLVMCLVVSTYILAVSTFLQSGATNNAPPPSSIGVRPKYWRTNPFSEIDSLPIDSFIRPSNQICPQPARADSKFPSNLFQRQFVSALAKRHRIHTICHIGYIPWAAVTGAHNIFFARDAEQIIENIGRHNTARTIRCSPSILSQDRHVQLLNEVSIELIDLQKTIDDTTTTISTEHEEPCGMIIAHFDGSDVVSAEHTSGVVMKLVHDRFSKKDALLVYNNVHFSSTAPPYIANVTKLWMADVAVPGQLVPIQCIQHPSNRQVFGTCLASTYSLREPQKPRYLTVIVRVMPHEYSFVREFLAYHELIGVDHFVLYTPEPLAADDELRHIIKPWVVREMVTFKLYVGQDIPRHWFTDDIRELSHWLAFIDLDEFIYMENDWLGTLQSRLRAYEYSEAIIVDRDTFDMSGHVKTPKDGLVIDHYSSIFFPARMPGWPTFFGKVFCHSTWCNRKRYNHHRIYPSNNNVAAGGDDDGDGKVDGGGVVITADFQVVSKEMFSSDEWGTALGTPDRHITSPLRINHYAFRSYEDCIYRQVSNFAGKSWRNTGQSDFLCNATFIGSDTYNPSDHIPDSGIMRYAHLVRAHLRDLFPTESEPWNYRTPPTVSPPHHPEPMESAIVTPPLSPPAAAPSTAVPASRSRPTSAPAKVFSPIKEDNVAISPEAKEEEHVVVTVKDEDEVKSSTSAPSSPIATPGYADSPVAPPTLLQQHLQEDEYDVGDDSNTNQDSDRQEEQHGQEQQQVQDQDGTIEDIRHE